MPELAAEALPADLQPAYVLCLGGYTGSRTLPDFAAHTLHAIVVQILHALQQSPAAQQTKAAAKASVELVSKLRQQVSTASLHTRCDRLIPITPSPRHPMALSLDCASPEQSHHLQLPLDYAIPEQSHHPQLPLHCAIPEQSHHLQLPLDYAIPEQSHHVQLPLDYAIPEQSHHPQLPMDYAIPKQGHHLQSPLDRAFLEQSHHLQLPTDPRLTNSSRTGHINMQDVTVMLQCVLARLGRLEAHSLDDVCLWSLQAEPTLDQLFVWSRFCGLVQRASSSKASAFMTSLLQSHKHKYHKGWQAKLVALRHSKEQRWHLGQQCQNLLKDARQAGLLTGQFSLSLLLIMSNQVDGAEPLVTCCVFDIYMSTHRAPTELAWRSSSCTTCQFRHS